ncbi:MAG TPA: sortase [Faecalibacterium sp.]|nr:sortase [Faecalibacterium sp.]
MKRVKRMLALLAAFALVLAMAVPAFADKANLYTISVPAGSNHTYQVYQIFTGDYSSDGKLSNIKWGQNSNSRGDGVSIGEKVDENVLNQLAAVAGKSDEDKLAVIEQYANLSENGMDTVSASKSIKVAAGYYLFKDTTTGISGNTYIAEVVGNVLIKAKNSHVPGFEKKLKDKNDTTDNDFGGWQDVADHDIGDKIPFKLEGTVPADYDAEYTSYYFAFHDEEEAGLTFNKDSVEVYVDDTKITAGFEVETSPTDRCSFEVVFSDLKAIKDVHAGSKIRVEYTATLNENAVIGGNGNLNKAQLEYSNNPRDKDSRGKTVWDNVVVFTYQVVVNKYANSVGENNKLPGAEFTLSKKLKDGTTKDIAVVKSEEGKQFIFKGLDDGVYTLTEIVTPEGYNTIDPITFTVTATHGTEWNGEGVRGNLITAFTGNAAPGEITFTPDKGTGALTTNVINKSGTTLPSTGGMGTTVFYVVGGGLMAVAVVLLVTKKRMENKR